MTDAFTILLADDDPDDHFIIAEAFKEHGCTARIISVYNGLQLLHFLLNKNPESQGIAPDLVLLDINMPIMDGLTALRQIRANEKLKDLAVFVISTTGMEHTIKEALELGVKNYYVKPGDIRLYKGIVDEICYQNSY